jgi:hypothetical protein
MRPAHWLTLAAVAAVGIGVGLVIREGTADAAPVRVTSSQLLINQRISQAGVRRSNEALDLLAPIRPAAGKQVGWASGNLLNGAVTNAKLGSNAVTGSKIADGSVANADLANNAVSGAKIADGAVANAELANNAVTSAKIADGTIAEADLAAALQAKLTSLFAVVVGTPPTSTALVRGSGVTGVARVSEGVYAVSFNQNVTACAYSANTGDPGSGQTSLPQFTSVSGVAGNPNGVLVRAFGVGATGGTSPVDTNFHLVVTC